MEVIGFILFVLFIAFCVWAGLALRRLEVRSHKRSRAKAVEYAMRQEAEDMVTRKRVADKMLREAGERP